MSLNGYSWVEGRVVNTVDPSGLFNWCTGGIEQGDTLGEIYTTVSPPLDIRYVMRSIGAANVGHPIYSEGIGDYNIRINALQLLDPSWPSLNIPPDILAYAEINQRISCKSIQPSTQNSCDCDTGYIWRPDWQRCVPIVPTAPPPMPYEEFTGELPEWLTRSQPCSSYYNMAYNLGVLEQVHMELASYGRFPNNLNLPQESRRRLYNEYNQCVLRLGIVEDKVNCANAFQSVVLDVLGFISGYAVAASITISVLQVLENPSDNEAQDSLGRAVAGALNTDTAAPIVRKVGGELVSRAGRRLGLIFTVDDIRQNANTLSNCFGD